MITTVLIDLYAKNLDYAKRLVADLPEEKMAFQPGPGMNHPAWVIGHLAFVANAGVPSLLGFAGQVPAEWADIFGGKSTPSPDASKYPHKADLLAALESGHARVSEALKKLDLKKLDEPTPLERYRQRFPTLGHALIHMLVGHEQVHLGQLSAWRRVQGLPPV